MDFICKTKIMKKLTLIFTLLLSIVMFSAPSYAEWTKLGESVSGRTWYVNFERIRKRGEYVYFWYLIDYLKPNSSGDLSDKTYSEGDCNKLRFKWLSVSFHKEPMGGGTGYVQKLPKKYQGWRYPEPNGAEETILKKICSR